jgi:hypothetical protein
MPITGLIHPPQAEFQQRGQGGTGWKVRGSEKAFGFMGVSTAQNWSTYQHIER